MSQQYDDATRQAIAAVDSSTMRQRALAALTDDPASITTVADRAGMSHTPTSRALKDLRELGLAEVFDGESARSRPHRITERGKTVLEVVGDAE